MTVFNRKNETQKILESIILQKSKIRNIIISIFVIDGGSSDGTSELISNSFPEVVFEVREGYYWNSGMREAWLLALPQEFDFYLLLNNDVELFNSTFSNLEKILYNNPSIHEQIIVGSTLALNGLRFTYGPLKRNSKLSPIKFENNSKGDKRETVTFNANFVLISKYVVERLGILSKTYSHAFGDIDYGLRATKFGIPFFHLDFPIGICPENSEWQKIQLGQSEHSWKYLLSHPKGIPALEWFAFCRDHGGRLWFLRFCFRYARIAIRRLLMQGSQSRKPST